MLENSDDINSQLTMLMNSNPLAGFALNKLSYQIGSSLPVGQSHEATKTEPLDEGGAISRKIFEGHASALYPAYLAYCREESQPHIALKRFRLSLLDVLRAQLGLDVDTVRLRHSTLFINKH
jgi:hypothetical protein